MSRSGCYLLAVDAAERPWSQHPRLVKYFGISSRGLLIGETKEARDRLCALLRSVLSIEPARIAAETSPQKRNEFSEGVAAAEQDGLDFYVVADYNYALAANLSVDLVVSEAPPPQVVPRLAALCNSRGEYDGALTILLFDSKSNPASTAACENLLKSSAPCVFNENIWRKENIGNNWREEG
jgi:hypothetical protein